MPTRNFFHPLLQALGALALALSAMPSRAAQLDVRALEPSTLFVQLGSGDDSTRAYVFGATRDWNWHRQFSAATLSGYFEADFGRWTTRGADRSGSAWATQVGVTPVIRLQPVGAADHWFAEFGIGANYILPLFQSGTKRFSTKFNFGDHVALGRRFGEGGRQELALRLQHFSNAGIDHPNPGENFVQLRYSHRL